MSVQALNWARQMGAATDLPAAQLLLLWLLADQANGQWECWPGVARLARESNQSERSVMRHLGELEKQGIIARYTRRGPVTHAATGEVYTNVRKSDLIVIQADALSAASVPEHDVSDPSESFEGWLSGRVIEGGGLGDNLSGSPRSQETREGDNLSPSLRAVDNQGDNLSPRGLGDNLSPSSEPAETREGDNLSPRGSTCQSVQGLPDKSCIPHARVNRARGLNPHLEPSSSSSVRESYRAGSAGDGRDDDDAIATGEDVGANHRGVSLHALGGVVAKAVGWECTSEQLTWLIDVILDRSARPVGRPARFVTAAVTNDPAAIREELAGRFGRPGTEAASAPAAASCPIPEHAEQGLLAVNCPACRKWRDFPPRIAVGVLDRLDPEIRRHVLDREDVEIVDDESQRTG